MFVRIHQVVNESERLRVFRFRYEIYAEELNKKLTGIDHHRRLYADELDQDALILVAIDPETGRIVGTLRSNCPGTAPLSETLGKKLNMEPVLRLLGPDQVGYSSALMVDPVYRGRTAASPLFLHLYRHLLDSGRTVELCVAEFALVHLYYQLGFRPYGRPFRPHETAGLRVPLALCLRDRQYLDKVRSPFLKALPEELDDQGTAANKLRGVYPQWTEPPLTPREKRALWAALAHSNAPRSEARLFDGFEEGEVAGLMQAFPAVRVARGEQVYRMGEEERGMGVVLEGELGVTLENSRRPHYIAVIGEGEVFGELAALVGHGRTANLVALVDAEVLILPHNLLDKLERNDPVTACRLSRNLNRVLGFRLAAMNRLIVNHQEEFSVRDQAEDAPSSLLPGKDEGDDSYSISTLSDPAGELERLETQARAGWRLELSYLQRAGFKEGATFLDLGCGPGQTTLLLAHTFPQARIIGIDPDEGLLTRAVAQAEKTGVQSQCDFRTGRGEDLPLADNEVDFCYARFVFQHLTDPLEVLKEMKRVTRPGGKILIMDVDDEGVVIHPEPAGWKDFQRRAGEGQRLLGGDREVGRRLYALMLEAGLQSVCNDVAPITSQHVPMDLLADIAVSFKEQTMRRTGTWTEVDGQTVEGLETLSSHPGAWMLIPVFFCRGEA